MHLATHESFGGVAHQASIVHLHWILKEEGLARKLASAGRKNVIE